MASEKLDSAVKLVKAGNRQAALPLLKDVIRAEPQNENAWLWLYACVEKVEEKKYCLQKALEINPNNLQARTALEKLLNPVQPSQAIISPNIPKPPADRGTGKRLLGFALMAVFFMLLCLIVPLFYFFQTGPLKAFAAPLLGLSSATPTSTSTLLPTFTPSFTPSPKPTLTLTATHRPSATLIEAFATPLGAPTIAAFTPGDPTATPLGSDITDVNFQKGLVAYNAKQYEAAIDLMTAAIEANPDLAPPYRYRAVAYSYLNRCYAGLPDIEKALSIDPNYASAWAGRATLELCLGKYQKAIPDLQKALSLDGSLSVAHFNLGVVYFLLGNFQKSLEEYTLSAEVDPSRSAAWSGKSEALFRMGHLAECIESAAKAIETNPQEWLAYTDRADCEMALQQYTEAIKDYTVYINRKPDNETDAYYIQVAYFHRGDANLMLEKYVEAVRDYELAKPSMSKNDAHFYCQLSYAYFGAKRYQDTLDTADESIRINPACGGQKLLIVAARAAFALGDNNRALAYINKAVAYHVSSSPLAYYYRGVILQKMGNKAEAIQSFKQFLGFAPKGPEADDTQARLTQLEP